MSIYIISNHIIMLRQNFIIILSVLIKQSLKVKGGTSAPKARHPWIRPCHGMFLMLNNNFSIDIFLSDIETQGSMEFRNPEGPVLWCMSEARAPLQGLRVSKFC